ncbi:MAG: hypothetical protein R3B93_22975 [Bacteroidia bacterium]
MGVSIYLGIAAINQDNETVFSIHTQERCDGLCLMLFNKTEDYVTGMKLNEILNQEEIDFLNVTYGKESGSVGEGLEAFQPILILNEEIKFAIHIIDKIIKFLNLKMIDELNTPRDYLVRFLDSKQFDSQGLSQIRAGLEIALQMKFKAYLFINDW